MEDGRTVGRMDGWMDDGRTARRAGGWKGWMDTDGYATVFQSHQEDRVGGRGGPGDNKMLCIIEPLFQR